MADHDLCTGCGSPLPPQTSKGMCPTCLQYGLDDGSSAEGRVLFSPARLRDGSALPAPARSSVMARIAESIGDVPHILLRDTEILERARADRQAVVTGDALSGRTYRSLPALRRDRPRRHGGRPARAAMSTWAGTSPSRSCSTLIETTPTWCADSSRRPRSAASCSTPASCQSTSSGASPTGARSSR